MALLVLYENKVLGRAPRTLFFVKYSRQCFNIYIITHCQLSNMLCITSHKSVTEFKASAGQVGSVENLHILAFMLLHSGVGKVLSQHLMVKQPNPFHSKSLKKLLEALFV